MKPFDCKLRFRGLAGTFDAYARLLDRLECLPELDTAFEVANSPDLKEIVIWCRTAQAAAIRAALTDLAPIEDDGTSMRLPSDRGPTK